MTTRVLIPGTFNSRDVSSVATVTPRVLIRSDAPLAIGPEGRAALRTVGIRTAIDLREPVERRLDPPDFDGLGLTRHEQPVFGEGFQLSHDITLAEVYRRLLDERGDRLTAVVRRLAAPGALPALVFCSAGKDRTGLVSALTLGAIGVSEDEIIRDYAVTEENMHGEFREAIVARARDAGFTEQELISKVGAPPELMRETLAWLSERYDGPTEFLRHHGMTEAERGALSDALLNPGAAQAA
jgi:protein-tyrosine phosphatase